ncbi:terminase small subunit [Chitinilyticum litopenaei]|uniref:terminase small subunit n=1 Tax=Chitinilyticum litopenaei TaxID=1121276 RepID=UPI00048EFD82|nr:terminase small subunit [Chitinilyticum litopenaei]
MSLTPKQAAFVAEYLKDLNATQAAIRAGYSEKTANEQGSRLLANVGVGKAIKEAMKKREERTEITQDRVLNELAKIAFGDARDVMSWGPDGLKLKPSDELTADQAALVSEVSETLTAAGGSMKLKTNDKLKALELIGRHLAMFTDKQQTDITTGGEKISLNVSFVDPK